jgi:hypothetical protein
MADAALGTQQAQVSGGFRIETRPNDLFVTKDQSISSKRMQLIATVLVIVVFIGVVMTSASDAPTRLAMLSLIFGVILLRVLLARTRNLHCTRESLEIIQIRRGKVRATSAFPRSDVGLIKFSAVSYSRNGATMGLVFTTVGVKQKILAGLECPEADTILKHLDQLGYDVEHDVGMPMMVEMALERRNSKWKFF